MEAMFRLPDGARRDPAIEEWLNRSDELTALARIWFKRIRECGDDVRELMHDGCPTACVDDAAFAYVNVFKGHTNVGFFRGAYLDDPAGLLEGTGKNMRHVKLKADRLPDSAALASLIDAAYIDMKLRLRAE